MKKQVIPPPAAKKTVYTIWKQVVNLIPPQIVLDAARETKVLSRTFTPWSHLLALAYLQLAKTESLNGVCDVAKAYAPEWCRMRNAQLPRRNTLSNANKRRDPKMAELVFWRTFEHLRGLCPSFASCGYTGYLRRFRSRAVHALDSTTIKLALNCFDWARHRRRKAAAKLHLNLALGNRLPSFAIVEAASHHDSVRAEAATANLADGDVLVADRAYTDFRFLCSLALRGVFYVVRWKRNIRLETVSEIPVDPIPEGECSAAKVRVLKDEIVRPEKAATAAEYSAGDGTLRRVTAEVDYDGQMLEMSFLTNNLEWSARTIAELYRARWGIETFFKELKQTCQIRDFIGYSENAVKWQVWTGPSSTCCCATFATSRSGGTASRDSRASSAPARGCGGTSSSYSNPTDRMGQHVARFAGWRSPDPCICSVFCLSAEVEWDSMGSEAPVFRGSADRR